MPHSHQFTNNKIYWLEIGDLITSNRIVRKLWLEEAVKLTSQIELQKRRITLSIEKEALHIFSPIVIKIYTTQIQIHIISVDVNLWSILIIKDRNSHPLILVEEINLGQSNIPIVLLKQSSCLINTSKTTDSFQSIHTVHHHDIINQIIRRYTRETPLWNTLSNPSTRCFTTNQVPNSNS